jgi:lipoprotein-anchoring transpeptidase ErfK/SrfK
MKNKKIFIGVGIASLVVVIGGFLAYRHITIKSDLRRAQKVYQAGAIPEALPLFEAVYARAGKSGLGAEALAYLCQGYNATENYDKSISFAQELLNAGKGPRFNAMALYWLGNSLGKKKEYGKAMSALAELLEKYKTSGYVDDAMLELAKVKRAQGQYLDGLDLLRQMIDQHPNSNLIKEAINEYGDLNIAILFSPMQTRYSVDYVIKKGDVLPRIAQKFNTTLDLLKVSNGTGDRPNLHPGDHIKVTTAAFSMVINKSKNTLTLLANGELFKVYSVGTGKMNSTPVGKFHVTNKLANPPWYRPGGGLIPFGSKENLLGTRWMGINSPGYGIHGTWEPDTIGKQSSAGCIRMLNSDVEELYKIIIPGTEVTIID